MPAAVGSSRRGRRDCRPSKSGNATGRKLYADPEPSRRLQPRLAAPRSLANTRVRGARKRGGIGRGRPGVCRDWTAAHPDRVKGQSKPAGNRGGTCIIRWSQVRVLLGPSAGVVGVCLLMSIGDFCREFQGFSHDRRVRMSRPYNPRKRLTAALFAAPRTRNAAPSRPGPARLPFGSPRPDPRTWRSASRPPSESCRSTCRPSTGRIRASVPIRGSPGDSETAAATTPSRPAE